MERLTEPALKRLEEARARLDELGRELSDPATFNDGRRAADLGREQAELGPVVQSYQRYRGLLDQLEQADDLLRDERDQQTVPLAELPSLLAADAAP